MGKNRDRAEALFNAFEKELTEAAKASGRDVELGKKWRTGMLRAAEQRGLTIKQLIDEVRPTYLAAVHQANQIDTEGESVPFALWGPQVSSRH
jgi:hypothetical protein